MRSNLFIIDFVLYLWDAPSLYWTAIFSWRKSHGNKQNATHRHKCYAGIYVVASLFQYFLKRIAHQSFCNHVNVTLSDDDYRMSITYSWYYGSICLVHTVRIAVSIEHYSLERNSTFHVLFYKKKIKKKFVFTLTWKICAISIEDSLTFQEFWNM